MVVKGEAVTIMNGSVDLRYDQKTEQLYASLNPDDKPALQRHVKRLLEAQAGHRQVPQGQGREDVERE
jgi:hypothetical protein